MKATIYTRRTKYSRVETVIELDDINHGTGEIKSLLRELKRKLGTGGYLDGDRIVLRGDQRKRLRGILANYGIIVEGRNGDVI